MKRLNHKEEEIMHILWKLENAFVKDIIAEMGAPKPPYNTISSIIRKLDKEGIIGHESFGNTYRYFPVLTKENYRKTAFRQMLENYFSGEAEQVLSYFVKEEKMDPTELDRLLDKIKTKDNNGN